MPISEVEKVLQYTATGGFGFAEIEVDQLIDSKACGMVGTEENEWWLGCYSTILLQSYCRIVPHLQKWRRGG